MNFNNFVHLKGNVTKKPVLYPNKDGSCTALFTLAVTNSNKNPVTGEHYTDFVSCSHYVKPGSSLYNFIDTGTPLEIRAYLQTVPVGEDPNVNWKTYVRVTELYVCESLAAKEARLARKASAETAVREYG